MSLTKANFRMIDGAAVNVMDHGAIGDGVADDSAAILAAIAAAGPYGAVVFPPSVTGVARPWSIGTTTIQFLFGQTVHGNHAELIYDGFGTGVECADISPTVWAQRCAFYGLLVKATQTGANVIGWRVNTSYSIFVDCAASVLLDLATAWLIDADFVNGSGSYYNHFTNCDAIGKVGLTGGVVTQQGWRFNRSDSAPTRGPNANSFIGGRTSDFFNAWEICGAGNSIFHPTVEGTEGTGFIIDNDAVGSTGAGCIGNSIFGPYFEGKSLSNPDVFNVGANFALDTAIVRPYVTSFGGGTLLTNFTGNRTAYDAGSKITGTFTPVLATTGTGTPIYAASGQVGHYQKDGEWVTFSCAITLATAGTFTGIVSVQGLPFTSAVGTNAFTSVTIGIVWNALAIGSGQTMIAYIGQNATEIFIRKTTGAALAEIVPQDSFQITLSGTYRSSQA